MSNETKRIPDGTEVTWESQSGSYRKTKAGLVLAFVPAWKNAGSAAPDAFEAAVRRSQRQFDGSVSAVDRYIVYVPRWSAKGAILPPHYYAPLASVVERQNADKLAPVT